MRDGLLQEQDVRKQYLVEIEFAAVSGCQDRHCEQELRNGEEAPEENAPFDYESELVENGDDHPNDVRVRLHLPFLDVRVKFNVKALAVHLKLSLELISIVAGDSVVGLATHVADKVPVFLLLFWRL